MIVFICVLWDYLCIVHIPIQSIHGLVWCGCACVLCVHLCDVDVPVPQVFLYVSVPG